MKTTKYESSTETQSSKGGVRERCLESIYKIVGKIGLDEQAKGNLDDLDFIEIVMQTEVDLEISIKEEDKRIDDFYKVSDLLDWLVSNAL